jgi:DNA-binding Lrp family transcriptional regulator
MSEAIELHMQNEISKRILKVLESVDEPLETMEIVERLKDVSRTIILNRLHQLRGEGLIRGKRVGGGKGVWIWWRVDAFKGVK